MEYQVTATRLRPQKFEDLLGQEFVAATLQKSIEAGKIAHAYLFSGPRGCGKTSSARILAKVINCIKGPTASPCGECVSCQEITAGSCLDVIEIDGASNTSVNDVRQIKDEILFPPNSNRYKVYIIDEVHMLSTSAFNALLKTIEEPPPYVVFIFATTEIHKVPATIKSRCQQFNFKLVPVEILKDALGKATESSGIKADEEALYWIAREATGSVRDAYTLFDQVAAFSDGHITFEKIHEKLGLTGIDSINSLVLACVQKKPTEALNIIDEILQKGISVEQVVLDCADYFRSLLLIKHNITKEALIGHRADRFPAEILNGWTAVQIEQALSITLQLFRDLRFSIDPRYELELAVSRLAWLVDYVSPADLKTAFDSAKNILRGNVQAGNPNSKAGNPNLNNNYSTPQGNPESFSQAGSLTEQFKAILRKDSKADLNDKTNFSNKAGLTDKLVETSKVQETAQTTRDNLATEENKAVNQEVNKIEDLDVFKENIIKALAQKNALLASTLERTKDWVVKDDELLIYVNTAFDVSFLQKQISILQSIIEAETECKLQIKIQEVKEEIEAKPEDNKIPEFIQFVINTFNGQLIEKKLISTELSENENLEGENSAG